MLVQNVEETERYAISLIDHMRKSFPDYYDAAFAIKFQLYGTIESVKTAIMRL